MNHDALRDLILATVPRNAGEPDADYFARCAAAAPAIAAAGRIAIVTSRPSSPDTMVKLRTLDWLFPENNGLAVRTITRAWNAKIAALTAAGGDEALPEEQREQALAAADRLTRTQGYMAGTGPLDGIDVADPGVRADVAALVPDVLTQQQADAINALGSVTTYAVAADLTEQQVTAEVAAMARDADADAGEADAGRRYQLAFDAWQAYRADPAAGLPDNATIMGGQ